MTRSSEFISQLFLFVSRFMWSLVRFPFWCVRRLSFYAGDEDTRAAVSQMSFAFVWVFVWVCRKERWRWNWKSAVLLLLTLECVILGVRAFRRRWSWGRSERSLEDLERAKSLSARERGREFERWICSAYRSKGYDAELVEDLKQRGLVEGSAQDFGCDVLARNRSTGDQWVIQCKFYSGSVGVEAVQQTAAALGVYGGRGVVITQSPKGFTDAAAELADANQIELMDRQALLAWIAGRN